MTPSIAVSPKWFGNGLRPGVWYSLGMPTPVGHVLGAAAIYFAQKDRPIREDWWLAAACAGASLLPDLDFAITPFVGRSYHHTFTHSLGFAALFAAAVYVLARALERSSPLRDTGVLTAAYLSHIALDFLGNDTSPPLGVQLFWPLSDAFYMSPIIVFGEVWRGTLGKLFGLHNWLTVAREILILVPLALLLWWWRHTHPLVRRRRGAGGTVSQRERK